MWISAFDLFVLGTLVSLGGMLFLARAYWRASLPEGAADPMLAGHNPVRLRNEILQHSHTKAAVRWLTIGAIAFILGATRGSETGYLFGPWSDIFAHAAVLSLSWVVTASRTTVLSRKTYLPKIVDLYRPGFQLHLEYLAHQGCRQEEVDKGIPVGEFVRQGRLAEVTASLDQIGRLLDYPRRTGERDRLYAERLRPLFRSSPSERPSDTRPS